MYVDPGYGALIVQAILAGILGAVFVVRERLRLFIRKLMRSRPPSPAKEQGSGDAGGPA